MSSHLRNNSPVRTNTSLDKFVLCCRLTVIISSHSIAYPMRRAGAICERHAPPPSDRCRKTAPKGSSGKKRPNIFLEYSTWHVISTANRSPHLPGTRAFPGLRSSRSLPTPLGLGAGETETVANCSITSPPITARPTISASIEAMRVRGRSGHFGEHEVCVPRLKQQWFIAAFL